MPLAMNREVFITCAVTGSGGSQDRSPHVPRSPKQIADSAIDAAKAGAATLPSGFQETTVFTGLTRPTAIRFARDGRVFVAEKGGVIKVFDNVTSPIPTVFADLSTEVDDYWDRGLLGLALHPNFPETPYVYVSYTYDAPIGGTAPTWNDSRSTAVNAPNRRVSPRTWSGGAPDVTPTTPRRAAAGSRRSGSSRSCGRRRTLPACVRSAAARAAR